MRTRTPYLALLILAAFVLGCSSSEDEPGETSLAPIDPIDPTNHPIVVGRGATLVAEEDFEDGQWDDTFDGAINPANVSVAVEKAYSGSASARMHGGYLGAAFDHNVDIGEGEAYYVKYRAYYPSDQWNWDDLSVRPDQSDNTGMKNFRAMPGDGWPLMMIKENRYGDFRTHSYYDHQAVPGVPSSQSPGSWPTYDVWHTHEYVMSWSHEEGGFAWYLDGILISGVPFQQFNHDTWPSTAGGVNNLRICGGNGYPDGSTYFVDDIEIWRGTLSDFVPTR